MARKQETTGELMHCVGVRIRVVGSGVLRMYLRSLDNANMDTIPPLTMAVTTNREPTQLANFVDQYMQVHGEVTAINEYFNITKITLFVKPNAAEYPR